MATQFTGGGRSLAEVGGALEATLPNLAPAVGLPAESPRPSPLPPETLGFLQQFIASNPVSLAKSSGARLALVTRAAAVSTAGTTFATGADLLSSAITFTATGANTYILRVAAPWWGNTAVAQNALRVNLDGADGGFISAGNIAAAGGVLPCAGAFTLQPSVGSHSVNVRLTVGGGTGTVQGGAGGAGVAGPIIVTLEVA